MSAAPVRIPETVPYRQSAGDVLAAFGSDARQGLSEEEARAQLELHGRNELAAEKPVPGWKKFLAQFKDPLVILLLVTTAISASLWLYEREPALIYESDRDPGGRPAQRRHGLYPAVAGGGSGGGAAENVGGAGQRQRSAFAGLFSNRWLWGAVLLSLLLQVAVIYLPFLQQAFSTMALSGGDWLRCIAVASSVLWLREPSKLIVRARSRESRRPRLERRKTPERRKVPDRRHANIPE